MANQVRPTGKSLSFERQVDALKALMRQFPDKRSGRNLVCSIEDAALGAFAVFYTQSPSFLVHQTLMEQAKGKSNAQSLFGMRKIPTDKHIRRPARCSGAEARLRPV